MRLIEGRQAGRGRPGAAQEDGEEGHIVHVFNVHPFEGDVVVMLVGERRELRSVERVDT